MCALPLRACHLVLRALVGALLQRKAIAAQLQPPPVVVGADVHVLEAVVCLLQIPSPVLPKNLCRFAVRGAIDRLSEREEVVAGVVVYEQSAQVGCPIVMRCDKVRFEAGFLLCGG